MRAMERVAWLLVGWPGIIIVFGVDAWESGLRAAFVNAGWNTRIWAGYLRTLDHRWFDVLDASDVRKLRA